MIRAFVENPRLLLLTIAVLLVAGLGAFSSLPRTEDPRLVPRVAMVFTPFPGASAERVEALVTEKLELKLRQLSEIDDISSSSKTGTSIIIIDLHDELSEKEVELTWSRARDLIEEARGKFPMGAGRPVLDEDRFMGGFTMMVALTWRGAGEADLNTLGRYADELESRLRAASGTEMVSLHGRPAEEVLVSVGSHRLAGLGLTAADVAHALQQADAKVAAGELVGESMRVSLEVRGELSSVQRVQAVPLRVHADGSVIRVGDVAHVSKAERWPASDLAIIAGERGVLVAVRMLSGLRVDHWTQDVEALLADFNTSLPASIKAEVIFSQNGYTQARLGELVENILLGFVLILGVLLVSLGWRSALVVAAALPLTVLFTLTCMLYFDLPIHQMSVTGLVVALGIMVDNAIVMTDSISVEKQKGLSAFEAVDKSVRHLWLPLLGSTLTTILAFTPVALMPGSGGEFVGGIAMSVIFSLVGSYLISHTLVAGLAGRFVTVGHSDRWWVTGIKAPALAAQFERLMLLAMRCPKRSLLLVMLVPLLGFWGAGRLTEQFFPPSDRDMFHIEVHMSASASLEATLGVTQRISEVLEQEQGLKRVDWFVGRNAPAFYYNLLQNKAQAPNYAQAMVTTEDLHAANRLIPALQLQLDELFPEAQILVRKLEQGPPFNAPIEFRIFGPDLERLQSLGAQLRRLMSEVPDIVHTRSSMGDTLPKVWFEVNEDDSNRSGLPLRALSAQLQSALDGVVGGSVLAVTNELPVRVRLDGGQRSQLSELSSLNFVPAITGELPDYAGVPLTAIGHLRYASERGGVARRNGERLNTIEGYLRDGVLPDLLVARIQEKMQAEGFVLPPGYRMEAGGESAERNSAVSKLLMYVGVIVTLLVVVVVLSFNSFRLSGIIFSVAIQSAGLGLLCVYVFDYPFGFTVIIALLGLMGLAINAAIVILAEMKADPLAIKGDPVAVVRAVQSCSRHISSTTITTVGGFLPLILAGGGFWPPFAIAIAGGTVLATILSFIYVPVTFMWMARIRAFELSGAAME